LGDYATNAISLNDAGMDAAGNALVDINTWGTPAQILDKLEARRRQLGECAPIVQVSYGGLTGAQSEKSLRRFAEKLLPELHSWK